MKVYRSFLFSVVFMVALGFFPSYPAYGKMDFQEIPDGFKLTLSSVGVKLYRRDYSGGTPDFVQIIQLNKGAEIHLLHGNVQSDNTNPGVFGGVDARFTSRTINQYWKNAIATESRVFCITNGQFFYMQEYPTRLPFPLKINGRIITGGYSKGEFTNQKMMLELWHEHADIQELTKDGIAASTAPNIIAGLKEDARKSPEKYVGRTFVGVADNDQDGLFERVLIFSTQSARQSDAAGVLRSFGASKVMMFDGGLSTQLVCQDNYYIETERLIPQAIAIYDGTKHYRPTSTPHPTPTPGLPGLQRDSVDDSERMQNNNFPGTTIGNMTQASIGGSVTVQPLQSKGFRASDILFIPVPIIVIAPALFFAIQKMRKQYFDY